MQMRLILSPPQDGITNMATDQAIMEAVGDGHVPPTLRLYRWHPACLSLGYAQSMTDVDESRLHSKGWMLVRRPTGGRAILHTDELTYSISLPQDNPLVEGDIVTSYRRLTEGLRRGLEVLGLEAESRRQSKGRPGSAVCFETPSHYELTFDGRKLIGSAQVRRQKAVLQHGSLPLSGDITRICETLAYPNEWERDDAREKVRQRAITLEHALGKVIDWETAAYALVEGFEEALGMIFEESFLTPEESLRLEQLRAEVYSHDAWTYKR
ncbi:MAG: lipoate--protein ligase family protein [Anaerolineae bacterium]|nr:lipoate--protein ligase family protein [Anaerolineae bacterium]